MQIWVKGGIRLETGFGRAVATFGSTLYLRSSQWRSISLIILASVAMPVQAAGPQDGELRALRQEMNAMRSELRGATESYRRLQNSKEIKIRALEERVQQLEAGNRAAKATASAANDNHMPETSTTASPASSAIAEVTPSVPIQRYEHNQAHIDVNDGLMMGDPHGPNVRLGANMDLIGTARNFGPTMERRQIAAREVELAVEAQVTDWLYGFAFLTRPNREAFTVEEAAATAALPFNTQIKAGFYRPEFGYLNTVHEPERPQISLPLPVTEFLGEEQLREGAVTVGKWFEFGGGRRAGLSGAILNGDNTIALNGGISKAYTGKLYYGRQTEDYAYQLGLSALTGKNDSSSHLRTSTQAIDFRLFANPFYNPGYDYPSRFSLIGEVLFNQRASLAVDEITATSLRNTNRAFGAWASADYQFRPAHHIGLGVEYAQGRENKNQTGNAYSAHYSWYYTPHSRLQTQLRRVNSDLQGRGWEALLQWNVVLGPHSERPFLPILPFESER